MDKRFIVIGLIIFTEVIGFSLILPFLPYYAEEFGATPLTVGLIISVFSICQFISAPIIGKLSDRYGRRPLLIISQLSTLAGFLILGFANSLWMIFLSRLVDGLIGSNMTLSRAYLTDISTGKERRKQMGYMGAIFGLGMFIGPAIGGFFATISYAIPSFIAAGITVISILLTIIFLKETITKEKDVKLSIQDFFPLKDFIKGIKVKDLRKTFITFSFYSLAFVTITSSLALFVKHQLGLGPEIVGFLLMAVGLFRIIFQVTIMPKLIDKKKITTLISLGLGLLFISFSLFFFVKEAILLFIAGIILSIGAGLSRPMMIADISERVDKRERGKMMGVTDSIWSVMQIFGPLIGGFVIENLYPGIIGLIAASLILIALFIELGMKIKVKL